MDSRVRIVESFRAPSGIGQSLTLHHRRPSVLPSTIRLPSLSIFLSPLNTMSTVPAPDVADLRALSASSLTSGSAHRVRKAWVVKSLLSLLDLQSDQYAAESYPPPVSKERIKRFCIPCPPGYRTMSTVYATSARVSKIIDPFALETS